VGRPGKVRDRQVFHHVAVGADGPGERRIVVGINGCQARRASTAAIMDFPAPDMPVINTALIGVYRRPALKVRQNEFARIWRSGSIPASHRRALGSACKGTVPPEAANPT